MIKHFAPVFLMAVWTVGTVSAASVSAIGPSAPTASAAVMGERPEPTVVVSAPVLAPVAPGLVAGAPMRPAAVPTEAPAAQRTVSVDRQWHGLVRRAANVRSAPFTRAAVVRELAPGTPVTVTRWVAGEMVEADNPTWAEIAPGEYVFAMALQPGTLPAPVARPDQAAAGKWIDVDLTRQVVTAYEGATAVHTTFASTGRPGWETPTGTFRVQRRVAAETMDGSTLRGQGPDGQGATYRVENVKWTQYFTADGSAIHENSWRDPATFGIPGSHGCIGLAPAEAAWFWTWAAVGTSIVVHA